MKLKNFLGLVIASLTGFCKDGSPVIHFRNSFGRSTIAVGGRVVTSIKNESIGGMLASKHFGHAIYHNDRYMGDADLGLGTEQELTYRNIQKLINNFTPMVPPLKSCHDTLTTFCRPRGFYQETGLRRYGDNERMTNGVRRGEFYAITNQTDQGRPRLYRMSELPGDRVPATILNYKDYELRTRINKALMELAKKFEFTGEGMFPRDFKRYYS